MGDEALAFASATDLLELISTKQVSPVELTECFLSRIDRLDRRLNAFLELTPDEAMDGARAAEKAVVRGDALGALHGLPISIKDNQMTRGIRTTAGSLVFKDRIPERDAAVVERVRDAGAVILGKTNVPEFAMVGTCQNRFGSDGGNPWDPDCTPGGSSGGAAASVAAYLCPVATGSDGGGSIRIPAHFCGVYGIKPTQGRVSGYTGQGGTADALPVFPERAPQPHGAGLGVAPSDRCRIRPPGPDVAPRDATRFRGRSRRGDRGSAHRLEPRLRVRRRRPGGPGGHRLGGPGL